MGLPLSLKRNILKSVDGCKKLILELFTGLYTPDDDDYSIYFEFEASCVYHNTYGHTIYKLFDFRLGIC